VDSSGGVVESDGISPPIMEDMTVFHLVPVQMDCQSHLSIDLPKTKTKIEKKKELKHGWMICT
jgi:hypothetical protein